MHIEDLLAGMGGGEAQPDEAIVCFVDGVVAGRFSSAQIAAWLAFAYARGLTDREAAALTRAMTESGDVLRWQDGPLLIDKHSTGGVGDKVSLVLAPLWAELGCRVPMISGRGLGHTGGTLDKLEAIDGFRCDLTEAQMRAQLAEVGCFITGQTGEVAPADKILYALRNETSTVDSIPLIVASILSKKLAEGVQRLVLDVKTGSGAFMKTLDRSRALAKALVGVATEAGLDCSAVITAMDRPLGRAVGNAVEVVEAMDTLKGEGPADLREVTLTLADHPDAERVLASGAAYARFERMVVAQGGDPSRLRGGGTAEAVVTATHAGTVTGVDALAVGRAAFVLGGGRRQASDAVDFGVGVLLEVGLGDEVVAGQPLARLQHRDRAVDEATALLCSAITLGDGAGPTPPLVYERISP